MAARHLAHYGYKPIIYYPKQGKNELYDVWIPLFPFIASFLGKFYAASNLTVITTLSDSKLNLQASLFPSHLIFPTPFNQPI